MLRQPHRNRAGFTIIEVLLSVALLGILVGVSIPIYQTYFLSSTIDIAHQTLAQSLRRAQLKAIMGEGDRAWGVRPRSGCADRPRLDWHPRESN